MSVRFGVIVLKHCQYSIRLVNRLKELDQGNRIDYTQVNKAIYWAKNYHADQKRKSEEPYYTHPLEVAYMVSKYLLRTDIIVSSILHDTIEDTCLTYQQIKNEFGRIIANQVMDLTRIKEGGTKISSSELVELLWIQKKYDVLLIKQFDRLHNIRTIKSLSPEKTKKIIEETISSFVILAIYLEIPECKKELIDHCFEIMNIKPNNPEYKDLYYY